MTEQEALEAFFAERDRQANEYGASLTREQRDCAEEAWHAALAWLRSQGEPVGRFNWETGEFEFLVPWDYETHNMKPLYLAPRPAIPDGWQSVAARDVLAERRRQVEAEGWTPEHDDAHRDGVLALAASGYAKAAAWATMTSDNTEHRYTDDEPPESWPDEWEFKPGSPRAMLVKAGALILAEIERLDRASTAAPEPSK